MWAICGQQRPMTGPSDLIEFSTVLTRKIPGLAFFE